MDEPKLFETNYCLFFERVTGRHLGTISVGFYRLVIFSVVQTVASLSLHEALHRGKIQRGRTETYLAASSHFGRTRTVSIQNTT